MSTNEELVAAAKEHLAHNVWDDEIFVLADQLVTALEQVTAERDALLSAEELAAEDRGKLIEERDELAAVVQEALNATCSNSVPLGVPEARHYDRLLAETRRTLMESPSVALDHVKAEALREAADGFRFYKDYGYRAVVMLATENYLNDRADRIEKGESNDQ